MGYYAAAAAVVTAAGSILKGKAAKEAGEATAESIDVDSYMRAVAIRKMARKTEGEATAAYAAAGVDVNSPSALAVGHQISFDSEYDATNALISGELRANAARRGGNANAIGAYAGGASSLLSQYGAYEAAAG